MRIKKNKFRDAKLKKKFRETEIQSRNIETRKERFARKMRKAPTPSEDRLHQALKQVRHRCGWVINSQVVLGPYIADLYIPNLRVVIEVDGGVHNDTVEYDRRRDNFLRGLDCKVIHVKNEEVWADLNGVVYRIYQFAGLGEIKPSTERKHGALVGLEPPK